MSSLFAFLAKPATLASALVAFTAITCVTAYPSCSTTKFRNKCAPDGADELTCLEHDCCWSEEGEPGEHHCFHKNEGYKYFSLTARRIDCGWDGFTVAECVEVGCLHHDAPDVGPSCFFPNTNIDPARCGIRSDRLRCGDGFTQQEKCESLGCCWSPLEEGSTEPKCFYSPRDLSRRFYPGKKTISHTGKKKVKKTSSKVEHKQ